MLVDLLDAVLVEVPLKEGRRRKREKEIVTVC
jgi:hypothetical protein